MTRWTLHLRFGAGEAPGHEDRARWPSLLLQRAERNIRAPPRPTKNFEKIKMSRIFRWPVFVFSIESTFAEFGK